MDSNVIEYGRLIVIKKDGTEGTPFPLTCNIIIGRGKECDIRIKIPSVSRKHAEICTDENGKCTITNSSTTNLTTVNGDQINDIVELKDGDIFCVGERQFLFQDATSASAISHANLLKGYLPVLETIDESQTLDFVKHSILKIAKGKPLTPIRENGSVTSQSETEEEALVQAHDAKEISIISTLPVEPIAPQIENVENTIVAPNPFKMDMSIMEAINKRRKSYNIIKAVAVNPVPSTEESDSIQPLKVPTLSNTPAKSPKALKSQTPKKDVTIAPIEEEAPISRGNKMAFLQAINARRQSYSASAIHSVAEDASVEKVPSAAKKAKTPVKDTMTTVKETDIVQDQVNSAEKDTTTPVVEKIKTSIKDTETEEVVKETHVRSMRTPLRKAIQARLVLSPAAISEELPITAEVDEAPFTGLTVVVPSVKRDPHHFTTSSITRRMSVGPSLSNVAGKKQSRKSIAAPRHQSRKSMSKKPVNETEVDDEIVLKVSDRESILSTAAQAIETEDLQPEVKTTSEVDSVIQDMDDITEDKIASAVDGDALIQNLDIVDVAHSTPLKVKKNTGLTVTEVSIIEATCVQMVVDAFASELENQGVSAEEAHEIAVKSYLSEPEAFSPKGLAKDMIAPRRRDSLLASLEKKATNRAAKTLGSKKSGRGAGLEESQLSSELISALTDNDMEIIEAYACRLEDIIGGDPDEAYAIALDSFIRGVEHCHATVKVQIQKEKEIKAVPSVQEEVQCDHVDVTATSPAVKLDAFEAEVVDSDTAAGGDEAEGVEGTDSLACMGCDLPPSMPAKEENKDVDMGASLRALFALPEDYEGRGVEENDEVLVTRYAEDLQDCACIDAAVAYGIALDTFLADPVEFRYQIGGVKDRMPQRSPYRTPDDYVDNYEMYYDDEDFSPAMSTAQKPIMSNSHTYFTSPVLSSPIRMSILSEDAETEVECAEAEIECAEVEIECAKSEDEAEADSVTVEASNLEQPMEAEELTKEEIKEMPSTSEEVEKEVIDMAIEEEAVQCPTTPSAKALSAKKSAKKEAKSSVKKVEQTPFSALSTPLIVDVGGVVVEDAPVVVEYAPLIVAVESTVDVSEHAPEEDILQVDEKIIEEEAPETETPSMDLTDDVIDCPNDEQSAPLIVVNSLMVSSSPVSSPIVEPWIASAAATLQKSLPPKSAQKSGRKLQKVATPRQSIKKVCKPDAGIEGDLLSEIVHQQNLSLQLDQLLDFTDEEAVEVKDDDNVLLVEVGIPEANVTAVAAEIEDTVVKAPLVESGVDAEPIETAAASEALAPAEESVHTVPDSDVINSVDMEIPSIEESSSPLPTEVEITKEVTPLRATRASAIASTPVVSAPTPSRATRSRAATPLAIKSAVKIVQSSTKKAAEDLSEVVAFAAIEEVVDIPVETAVSEDENLAPSTDIQFVEETVPAPIDKVVEEVVAEEVAAVDIAPEVVTIAAIEEIVDVAAIEENIEVIVSDVENFVPAADILLEETVPAPVDIVVEEVIIATRSTRSKAATPAKSVPIKSPKNVKPTTPIVASIVVDAEVVEEVAAVDIAPEVVIIAAIEEVVDVEVPAETSECVPEAVTVDIAAPKGRGKRAQEAKKVEEVVVKRSRRGAQSEEPSAVVEDVSAVVDIDVPALVEEAPVVEEALPAALTEDVEVKPVIAEKVKRGRKAAVEDVIAPEIEEVVTAAPLQEVEAVSTFTEGSEEVTEIVAEVAPTPKARSTRGRQQVVEEEKIVVEEIVIETVTKVAPTPKARSTRGRQQVVEEEKIAVEEIVTEIVAEVAPTPKARSTRGRQQVVEEEKIVVEKQEVVDEIVTEIVAEVAPTPKARSTRGRQQVVEEEKIVAEKQEVVEESTRSTRKRCADKVEVVPVAVRSSRKKNIETEEVEDEEDALALLCDGCDGEYFLDDLGLKAIPKGDWFCVSCVKSKSSVVEMSIKKSKKTKSSPDVIDASSPVVPLSTKKEISKSDLSSKKRNIDTVADSTPLEGRRSRRLL